MREIKFRAWSKRKDMTGWATHLILRETDMLNDDLATLDKDLILMQYTGLKDKNGVEIYEGDIVENPGYGIVSIIFDDGKFQATRGYEWGMIDISCEVVGNIYENPELLK